MKSPSLLKLSFFSLALGLTTSSYAAQHISIGLESGYGVLSTAKPFNATTFDEVPLLLGNSVTNGSTYRVYVADWIDTKSAKIQWGVEAGYWTYPESHYKYNIADEGISLPLNVSYQAAATDLLIGLKMYFNPKFFATVQAGAAYVRNRATSMLYYGEPSTPETTIVFGASTAKTEILPEWSVGLGGNLSQHWTLGFSYRNVIGTGNKTIIDPNTATSTILGLSTLDATPSSISAYLVNLAYTF